MNSNFITCSMKEILVSNCKYSFFQGTELVKISHRSNLGQPLKYDVGTSVVCYAGWLLKSVINKLADWLPNYHKTVRTFPKIFCTLSLNKLADPKQ